MKPRPWKRWRGLTALVVDAVTHGSEAVERIQKETAGRPLSLLEKLPTVGPTAKVVHVVHDAGVTVTHGAIRLVARATLGAVDLALDVAGQSPEEPPAAGTAGAPRPEMRR